MNEIELKKLWELINRSKVYNFGTLSFDDFKSKMDTPEKRKSFWNTYVLKLQEEDINLGDYNSFESRLGEDENKFKDLDPVFNCFVQNSDLNPYLKMENPNVLTGYDENNNVTWHWKKEGTWEKYKGDKLSDKGTWTCDPSSKKDFVMTSTAQPVFRSKNADYGFTLSESKIQKIVRKHLRSYL
jgi:hypothetical protein